MFDRGLNSVFDRGLTGILTRVGISGEACHEQLSMTKVTNTAFEPANLMAKRDPRHGEWLTLV